MAHDYLTLLLSHYENNLILVTLSIYPSIFYTLFFISYSQSTTVFDSKTTSTKEDESAS